MIVKNSIYDSLGVFSAYNFTKNIGADFDKYSIDKLKVLKKEINSIALKINEVGINNLTSLFSDIENLKPVFNAFRQNTLFDKNTSKEFKKTALDFFDFLEWFQNVVHDEIHKHPYNKETEKALKEPKDKLKRYKNSKELFADLGI